MSSETEVTDAFVTDEKHSEDGSNKINQDSNGAPRSGDEEKDTDVNADKDLEEAGVERVRFVTTACGDYHNLAIDSSGDLP